MNGLVDAHYFRLPTQGNVYTLAILNLHSGRNKFIIGSLKKKVYSFEYTFSNLGVFPLAKEVSWTYIPIGVEVVAIDSFNKSEVIDDFRIGIAIVKMNPDGRNEAFLNIYSEQDPENNEILNIDSVAQNCLMIELDYYPYHLTHSKIFDRSNGGVTVEMVWLMSGSDQKIHVYREDVQNHYYVEVDVSTWFPEFKHFTSIVMWIDVAFDMDYSHRYSAVGCEDGNILIYVTSVSTNTVIAAYEEIFTAVITQVKLFTLKPKAPHSLELVRTICKDTTAIEADKSIIHLLVCCSNDASVIYMDIKRGLRNKHILQGIQAGDVCLTGCVTDMDFDGTNEVILGTFGQMLIMYKWDGLAWILSSTLKTSSPVFAIESADLTGDGMEELIVQTRAGVRVFKHDPTLLLHILNYRFKMLLGPREERPNPLLDEASNLPPNVEQNKDEEDDRCEEACEQ